MLEKKLISLIESPLKPGSINRGRGRGRGRGLPFDAERAVNRPTELQSKKGTSGDRINLMANYFHVQQRTDWHLRQYR